MKKSIANIELSYGNDTWKFVCNKDEHSWEGYTTIIGTDVNKLDSVNAIKEAERSWENKVSQEFIVSELDILKQIEQLNKFLSIVKSQLRQKYGKYEKERRK